MKVKIIGSLFIAAIIAFCSCEKEDPAPTPDEDKLKWNVELVDSIAGAEVGIVNKLTFDADSGIHVAYVNRENSTYKLKYAYKPHEGNWVLSEVDNLISDDIIDIAVDNQKNVFIVYRGYNPSDNNNDIMYIAEKSINGTFNKVMVNAMVRNDQARYPSIYTDNNDVVHISFERANYGMRYTTYSFQGTFTQAQILDDDITSSNSDIVVDSEGNKHIIHFHNQNVYYSYSGHSENSWTVNQIATGEVGNDSYAGISLAIDQFDNLHASFRHSSYDNNIHYLYKPAGDSSWSQQGIGNVGGSSRLDRAIACDTLGNPHILYDESFGLKIASKKTSWSHEHIFGDTNYRCDTNYDIKITDKNRAHVSFYNRTTGVLRYATRILE
jgi:hypothetical protein